MTASQPVGGFIITLTRRQWWVWGPDVTLYWGVSPTPPWEEDEPRTYYEWLTHRSQAYVWPEDNAERHAAELRETWGPNVTVERASDTD